jgi:hypothetical protein
MYGHIHTFNPYFCGNRIGKNLTVTVFKFLLNAYSFSTNQLSHR